MVNEEQSEDINDGEVVIYGREQVSLGRTKSYKLKDMSKRSKSSKHKRGKHEGALVLNEVPCMEHKGG